MTKTYCVLGLVVCVILAVYLALPEPIFFENVFPKKEGLSVVVYDNQYSGEIPPIKHAGEDTSLSYSCTLNDAEYEWCGLIFDLENSSKKQFRKWHFVDSVIVDIESQGTKEILLRLWTYDPDITEIDKPRSFRLLLKEVPLEGGRQRISVPLEDFYTPDFWFEENGPESKKAGDF